MSSDEPVRAIGPRAGFWRRLLAWVIDIVVISVPFQVIAAILFATTSGWIQQSGGITFATCVESREVPDGLSPPPPAGSNFTRECRVFFFGAETARTLQVARVTKEGRITKTIWRGYMLDANGHPIDGVSIDWLVVAVLIAYLFAMETQTCATLGDRWTRVRVVDASAPDAYGVPLRKIIIRYLATLIGFAPMVAVWLVYAVRYGLDIEAIIEAIAETDFFTLLILTGIPAFGWLVLISVQIAMKRDPLYDSIAGTAVVRVTSASA
jgi:RDD family protein